MSQELVGIGEPSPTGTSAQERRWAILRWLFEPRDAQFAEILEAANAFEQFVVGQASLEAANAFEQFVAGQVSVKKEPEEPVVEQVEGRKQSKQETLSKIEKVEETASKLVAGAKGALRRA